MAQQGRSASGAPRVDDERCSVVARAEQLDPGGTAAPFEVLVLVERHLPWPAEVTDASEVAQVAIAAQAAAEGRRVRVQAVLGVGHAAPEGRRRLLCYRRSPGAFAGFAGSELEVDGVPGPDAVHALLAGEGAAVAGTDVLVCSHGARDRCCGSFGTRLAAEMATMGREPIAGSFRLWRTSHTGGHRFAPTAVVLPYGDVWGFLDGATLRAILEQQVAPSEVLHLYRGSAGLGSPPLQLLDRFALGVEGWSWRERPRRAEETLLGNNTSRVRIHDQAEDRWYEGIVSRRRTLRLPTCGTGESEGKPFDEHELLAVTYPQRQPA